MTPTGKERYLGPRGYEQATYLLNFQQLLIIGLFLLGTLMLFVRFETETALLIVNAAIACVFLISTLYRMLLIDRSLRRSATLEITQEELDRPREWPRYVVQVPLYREPHAIPHLLSALGKLDYPKDRLTIQLLIEDDDAETKAALTKHRIAPPFTVVRIPVSYPRTKPKACNVGLAEAVGDYLVIYDAEDRPESNQLKKAVVAFSKCAPSIACIQAKLNFYNSTRNLITRCFTAEYAMWFDLCLPGLDALRAPIPLGGTSNHFRLDVLRRLKGWDEYNVTEDCDLGLRLFMGGWRTRIMESTTWEEACPRLPSWIRQRSRWVKGYVITYLVHTRKLADQTHKLGIGNSLHFHLLIGGSVISQLLAPFYWAMVIIWLIYRPEQLGAYFPGPVFAMAAICLFVGNFCFIYSCAIACACRGFGAIVNYTPLMLVYWIVMSLAAWKGTLQLIWRPHYWEKTQHHES